MNEPIQHLNPDTLFKSPAFSQAIVTQGPGKTVYIGGQNSINAQREIIGKGDLSAQTDQVMQNIQNALTAAGGTFDHVVKLGIYLVQGQNPADGFQSAQKFLTGKNQPTVTVLIVSSLGNPDFLVEVDAIAFIPES